MGSSDAVVDELEFVQHGDVETDTIEGRTDGEHAAYTWSMLSVIGIETEDRAALARSVVGILRLGQVRAHLITQRIFHLGVRLKSVFQGLESVSYTHLTLPTKRIV